MQCFVCPPQGTVLVLIGERSQEHSPPRIGLCSIPSVLFISPTNTTLWLVAHNLCLPFWRIQLWPFHQGQEKPLEFDLKANALVDCRDPPKGPHQQEQCCVSPQPICFECSGPTGIQPSPPFAKSWERDVWRYWAIMLSGDITTRNLVVALIGCHVKLFTRRE